MREQRNRATHRRIVRERLAHPHEHDAREPRVFVDRRAAEQHLRDNLRRSHVALQARETGRAKRTTHRAADLRRDTLRDVVRRHRRRFARLIFPTRVNVFSRDRCARNEHGFDPLRIAELDQQLARSVRRRLRVGDRRDRSEPDLRQTFAQTHRQIGHLRGVQNAALMDPTKDLQRAIARFAPLDERLLPLLRHLFGKIRGRWQSRRHEGGQGWHKADGLAHPSACDFEVFCA